MDDPSVIPNGTARTRRTPTGIFSGVAHILDAVHRIRFGRDDTRADENVILDEIAPIRDETDDIACSVKDVPAGQ